MSLKEKYLALEKNEQSALLIGGIAIVLFVLYQFIYEPFQARLKKKEQELHSQLDLRHWLNGIEPQLKQLNNTKTKTAIPSSKLLSITSNSLKLAKLNQDQYQLQQSSDESIQLSFKSVPYSHFINWISQFWQTYPLDLKELAINTTKTPGQVSVSLRYSNTK